FIVDEDSERRPVTLFTSTIDTPISVGILLDNSLSMGSALFGQRGGNPPTGDRWNMAGPRARALVPTMKPSGAILFLKFAATMSIGEPFASDHNKIESFLRELAPDSIGTDLVKCVNDAISETKKGKNRGRGVVVVTDAEDNGGRSDAAMKAWISSQELPVY